MNCKLHRVNENKEAVEETYSRESAKGEAFLLPSEKFYIEWGKPNNAVQFPELLRFLFFTFYTDDKIMSHNFIVPNSMPHRTYRIYIVYL